MERIIYGPPGVVCIWEYDEMARETSVMTREKLDNCESRVLIYVPMVDAYFNNVSKIVMSYLFQCDIVICTVA